jgi:hypothetical protein
MLKVFHVLANLAVIVFRINESGGVNPPMWMGKGLVFLHIPMQAAHTSASCSLQKKVRILRI